MGFGMVFGKVFLVFLCEFWGGVEIINFEWMYGKCLVCIIYILFLLDMGMVEVVLKVFKIVCGYMGKVLVFGMCV